MPGQREEMSSEKKARQDNGEVGRDPRFISYPFAESWLKDDRRKHSSREKLRDDLTLRDENT